MGCSRVAVPDKQLKNPIDQPERPPGAVIVLIGVLAATMQGTTTGAPAGRFSGVYTSMRKLPGLDPKSGMGFRTFRAFPTYSNAPGIFREPMSEGFETLSEGMDFGHGRAEISHNSSYCGAAMYAAMQHGVCR